MKFWFLCQCWEPDICSHRAPEAKRVKCKLDEANPHHDMLENWPSNRQGSRSRRSFFTKGRGSDSHRTDKSWIRCLCDSTRSQRGRSELADDTSTTRLNYKWRQRMWKTEGDAAIFVLREYRKAPTRVKPLHLICSVHLFQLKDDIVKLSRQKGKLWCNGHHFHFPGLQCGPRWAKSGIQRGEDPAP